MPRLFPVLLLVALAGCSGGPNPSEPASDTRPLRGTARDTAPPRGPTTGSAAAKATPREAAPSPAPAAHGPEQLQALIADLRDPDDARRVRAAEELRQWGREAEPAARALATAIAGAGPREAALKALEAISPERAADLHALGAEDDPAQRIAAAKHLAALPAEAGTPHPAAPLVPIIDWRLAALPEAARRPNVGYAVAGEEYAALVALLLKAGLDASGFQAIAACADVSPDGGRPLWEPAQLTLCALVRQGKAFHEEALRALDASLSSRVSVSTIRAVGDLGPAAKGLVPLLQTLATDRDENVRKAAAEALKKVQG